MHERIEQWEDGDPTGSQRAHPTGALQHLHILYGKGQSVRNVGKKNEWKDAGLKCLEGEGLESKLRF